MRNGTVDAVILSGVEATASSTGPRGGLSRGATGTINLKRAPSGALVINVLDADGSTVAMYLDPKGAGRLADAIIEEVR